MTTSANAVTAAIDSFGNDYDPKHPTPEQFIAIGLAAQQAVAATKRSAAALLDISKQLSLLVTAAQEDNANS